MRREKVRGIGGLLVPIIRGIICVECWEMLAWTGNVSKFDAVVYARKEGWTVGKKCICKECREEKAKERR